MSREFRRLDLADFAWILDSFAFRRRIDTVHLHHTWRPEAGDFRGEATVLGMWRFHTEQLGWSDIAQHVTIDPEGGIWPGRDWNRPPASASGHNGNALSGPFMIEMIGNFDAGQDVWEGAQREVALEVVALEGGRVATDPRQPVRDDGACSAYPSGAVLGCDLAGDSCENARGWSTGRNVQTAGRAQPHTSKKSGPSASETAPGIPER